MIHNLPHGITVETRDATTIKAGKFGAVIDINDPAFQADPGRAIFEARLNEIEQRILEIGAHINA